MQTLLSGQYSERIYLNCSWRTNYCRQWVLHSWGGTFNIQTSTLTFTGQCRNRLSSRSITALDLLRRNSQAPLHCLPQDVHNAPHDHLRVSPRDAKPPADLDNPFMRNCDKVEGIAIRSNAVNRTIATSSTSTCLPSLAEACQVHNELGERNFKMIFGFGFDDDQEWVKASIRNLATECDNTDTVIHSAVNGGCVVDGNGCLPDWFWGEFVGERDFATNFDIFVRPRCPRSIIGESVCFALLRFSPLGDKWEQQ